MTTNRRVWRRASGIVAVIAVALANACGTGRPPPLLAPAPQREWPTTLDEAQRLASNSRLEAADSVLARFATQYAGSREALETAYWRAIFKLDPLNKSESLAAAMSLLDAYLTESRPREHVVEATTLRRFTAQMDALAKVAPTVIAQREPPSPTPARAADSGNADAEIKRLKDELAKANAELERIRRRLLPPKD